MRSELRKKFRDRKGGWENFPAPSLLFTLTAAVEALNFFASDLSLVFYFSELALDGV